MNLAGVKEMTDLVRETLKMERVTDAVILRMCVES